jgi:DNA-binding NarL/FixJ family response regulator
LDRQDGYRVKGVSPDRLAQAIREAYAGRSTLAPEAVQALVSISTLKYHLRGIYSKLGAVNRAEAVALALGNKLIPSQPKAPSRSEGS